MLCALHEVKRCSGGLAVCAGGRTLSSLTLPVIPELRLIDRRLVDVDRSCVVPLQVA